MSDKPELFSFEWWAARRAQAIFIHSVYFQIEGRDSELAEYYHEVYRWIKDRIKRKERGEV